MNIFDAIDNSTPLTEEEKLQLKAKWITTRQELNEIETKGLIGAEIWLLNMKKDILEEDFIKTLHKKMFEEVWKWAGVYRTTENDFGAAPNEIQQKIKILLQNVKNWLEKERYTEKEIAMRCFYGLIKIHPFLDGNARLARIMADLIMRKCGLNDFQWTSVDASQILTLQKKYKFAMQEADKGNFKLLIKLAN